MIKDHEKFRPTAYLPTKNDIPTIGYGHTRGVQTGDVCTLDDALGWLADDLVIAEAAIRKHVTVPLTQNQFDALVSLVFNIGEPHFAESTLLRMLNDSQYGAAAAQFDRWVYQKKRKLPGLVTRRAAERKLFES
jgi:lysozyme